MIIPTDTTLTLCSNAMQLNRNQAALRCISSAGDSVEFHSIRSLAERTRILNKLTAMQRLELLTTGDMTIQQAVRTVARDFADERGFSAVQLNADYQLWRQGGRKRGVDGQFTGPHYMPRDWHIFRAAYTNGEADAMLSNDAFVSHVRYLATKGVRRPRSPKQVLRQLLDEWFGGIDIPGVGTIRRFCALHGRPVPPPHRRQVQDYPKGWSLTNIARMLPSNSAQSILAKYGEAKAHDEFALQLFRDRSKLMPLQYITFDDHPCDIDVLMPMEGAKAQRVRPIINVCMDIATGYILACGIVGSYERQEDGDGGKVGTKRALMHGDVNFQLISVLMEQGTPHDWTLTALMENASSVIGAANEAALSKLLPQVQFEHTGVFHRAALSSFDDTGGMAWQKGWIEAGFGLLENHLDVLPATTGRRYDAGRGDHDARMREALKIAESARKQGIPLSEMKLPCLTLDEFSTRLMQVIDTMNHRTDHTLQGYTDPVYYVLDHTGAEVTRSANAPLFDMLCNRGAEIFHRKESPFERFHRLKVGHVFDPVHPAAVLPLVMEKQFVTITRNGVIHRPNKYADPITFYDETCAEVLAQFNSKPKALFGFMAADKLQIHLFTNDENMAYVCSPCAVGRVNMADSNEHYEAIRRVRDDRQRIRDAAAIDLAPQRAEVAAMRKHNERRLNMSDAADRISTEIAQAEERSALSRPPKANEVRERQQRFSRQAEIARQLADNPI